MARNDNWTLDPSDDGFLVRQGANGRERVLAAGSLDGVSPARIGEVAGFGGGKSNDPEKQRKHWSSAVSRAAKRGGQVIPRIQVLIDALRDFRTHGEGPQLALEREVLEKLSVVIRGSNDATVISAARTLLDSYRRDGGQTRITAADVVNIFVRQVGAERTLRGLQELDAGHLIHAAPELFEDYEARLERLENEYGKHGSAARGAGDDAGNLNGRGLRKTGDDAAGKVDERLGNVGRVDSGERPDSSREIDGRLGKLEAATA